MSGGDEIGVHRPSSGVKAVGGGASVGGGNPIGGGGATDGKKPAERTQTDRSTRPGARHGATRLASGVDRRSFLRRGGIVGLAGVGGILTLPAPPTGPAGGSPSAVAADDEFPYQGETIASEDDAPIARYQYRQDGDEYVPTAPINVVFPLADREAGLETVLEVLDDLGWTRYPEEYARYAWDREGARYLHQKGTAAETYFGMHGRLHVRCWEFEGVVSMQAHEDTAVRPRHGIESYADAEASIAEHYQANGWRLAPTGVDLENARGPDHDGTASILRPEEQ